MSTIIDLARDVVEADIGTLFLYDADTKELVSHVAYPEPVDIAIPSTLGIAGSCFSNSMVINTSSPYTDSRFYSGIDRKTGAPTLAILAVPIISRDNGQPLGVIELLNKKRTTSFTSENEKELVLVSKMAATIVQQAHAEMKSETDKRHKRSASNDSIGETETDISNVKKAAKLRRTREKAPVLHFKQNKEN